MMNICVFGDSVAKGVVFDEIKNKYGFLRDSFINIVGREKNISFKNFAKFGCTTVKGNEILEKQAYTLENCQYTILEFGGNDCDMNWQEIAESPLSEHQPNVPLEKFSSGYEHMIEMIVRARSKPVLLTLPPLDASRFFIWVSRGLNEKNILTYLGNDVDYIYRWHEGYNDMIFQLGKKYKLPIIDIRRDFLMEEDYRDFLCIDGMHPNEAGHRLIAKSLEKNLPLLA